MHALLRSLVDFLWPAACPGCLQGSDEDVLCGPCARSAPRLLGEERIRLELEGLDRVLAAFRYDDPLRRLLLELKYAGNAHAGRALGALLGEELSQEIAQAHADCVIPIPLSRRRLRERGYNQALLIAAPIAASAGLPLLPSLLVRPRHQVAQASLSGAARRRNVRGSFEARGCLGRAILLVDDVITTGSTFCAAAAALRAAGARRIVAVGLCAAIDPRSA